MPSHPIALAVTPTDEQFFKALGTRIAELRKEQGLSQQALADELGIMDVLKALLAQSSR